MNKRLVWNFELLTDNPLDFRGLPQDEPDILRWEARFFWPENTIVCLQSLSDSFLDLSGYNVKKRQDSYFIMANKNLNIKKRRDELLYKPLVKQTVSSQGFGKKVNLLTQATENILMGTPPLTTQQLFTLMENHSQMDVIKTALIHKLPTTPTIKLEFARLCIHERYYLSVCVEGRSEMLVNQISKCLLPNDTSTDYVRFLQDIQCHD